MTLAPDVAAEVRRRRRELGQGTSEAINDLARSGLTAPSSRRQRYRLPVSALGARMPLDNIADVLDMLDQD